MTVSSQSSAPYAPASAIMGLVERYRSKGLPTPIDHEVLARAGVSESLIKRTLQALRILDLIEENGQPTPVMESIRLAPEAEFKGALLQWLQSVYADVLQFVDPATATETQLRDAFRSYQPQGQQPRMITLFTGLFRSAGVGPASDGAPKAPRSKPNPIVKVAASKKERLPPKDVNGAGSAGLPTGLHPALVGLLSSLPAWWTKSDRDRFMTAFGAVLDLAVPIAEADPYFTGDASAGFGS